MHYRIFHFYVVWFYQYLIQIIHSKFYSKVRRMPSRKIIKTADVVAKNELINFINNQPIRTFFQEDSLTLLSKPSHFISLHMKKNINKEVSRLRKLCAHRKFAYLTDIQSVTFLSYFTIHKSPIQDKWAHGTYSNFKDF